MIHGFYKLSFERDLKTVHESVNKILDFKIGPSELLCKTYCSEQKKLAYEKEFDLIIKECIFQTEKILSEERKKVEFLIKYIFDNKIKQLSGCFCSINSILNTCST